MPTVNSAPPAAVDDRVLRVPLDRLHAHPSNPNLMSDGRLETLARNIEREGRYPPLIARPHPELPGQWQLFDGHQRVAVLRRLGYADAVIYPWDCDDEEALMLLATLNRLEGEDVPARRAALLVELTQLVAVGELALLLPEDGAQIEETLALFDLEPDALTAELAAAAERGAGASPRVISFTVLPEDEQTIERAIATASGGLDGTKRRGRALAAICRVYSKGGDV